MTIYLLRSRYSCGATAGLLALAVLSACSSPDLDLAAPVGSVERAEAASPLVYPPPPAEARFIHEETIYGSAEVVPETSSDRFREFATGYGRRAEVFGKPFGLVVRNGRIYVSDTVRRVVHVLDRAKNEYRQIGATEPGRLAKPLGLAIDDSGRIYVCDATTRRVLIYSAGGDYITAIGGPSQLRRPSSVAVEPDGSRVYVLDTGGIGSDQHGVVVFGADGQRVSVFGRRGAGPGEFNLPLAVERAADGAIYVVDAGNFRVQKLKASGQPVSSFGKPGRYPGQFGHPKDIALDEEGNIYVTDTSFGVFQVFNRSGRILLSVGERNEEGGRGRFLLPAGIDVDVDGRVYVVDQYFRKIEVFRPAALSASSRPGVRLASPVSGLAETTNVPPKAK